MPSEGPAPVDFEEYVYTTRATFAIYQSLRKGKPTAVALDNLACSQENKNRRGDEEQEE
jgi:hypothetical protein